MNASTGTLIWIGPRATAETRDAFSYCQRHASQLALRQSVADAAARPADAVSNIVVSRQARQAIAAADVETLAQQYPAARRTVLVGSNAEGEGRTGIPWKGWQRIDWHAWNQNFPNWFCDQPSGIQPAVGLTLVVAATLQHAAALLDTLDQLSVAALWQRSPSRSNARHVQRVIWDDSAAPATTASGWQQRLQSVHLAPQARHAWTVHYPRAHQWASARRGGIDVPLSKPYLRDSILRFLSPATQCP